MDNFEKILEYFDHWNELKKDLHFNKQRPYFKEREVWWASMGHNLGDEENGKNERFERPVLIVRGFYNHLFLALPLSTQPKKGNYYYPITGQRIHGIVILSQIKILDAKRLIRKIEMLDELVFIDIIKKFKDLI